MPVRELAARRWDVLVVGAGHNGLACAAYLARAGKQVLVLEARERVGGACTLEEPWPGFRVSPCAYLAGLLHPLVIEELNFPAWGYHWTPATAGMFVPFEDGSYVQLPEDDDACEAEIGRFAPRDLAGWRAMGDVMRRARNALRPAGSLGGAFSADDLWLDPAPSREQIEQRLAGDDEARGLLFDWSMVEYVERYLSDVRLQMAYLGQGVIGTFASPFDPGTASVNFHHSSGRLGGMPGMWGYVRGGMGMVSFILCDIARELGAVVAAGVPVARILPGEGVELAGGERIHAPVIVSNADPRTTLALLGRDADPAWRAQVESVPIEGCSMKVSVALRELPNFTAKPGVNEAHHRGQINTPLTKAEWRQGYAAARAGGLPDRLWTELYFQTAFDDTVAPAGAHLMSVFAQYVPYNFTAGNWDGWRERAGQLALDAIARFCSNIPDAILHTEVIGPRDIEQRVGLAGGHIFQGEILPQYMWDQRLSYQTPMDGIYLCGAATHPGGSVIAVNGRNAALAVLGKAGR
jgi:phytoene dehydrogenase-like protein